jgi:hypothetical protein
MPVKQGDLRLLETGTAQRLLSSRIPARFAYIATDGTPRVLATWFHWTGEVLAMPTFLAAPHVRHPAGRLAALRANSEVDGIPAEYASAARRYLGDEAAQAYLAQIDQPGTRMASISLHPTWVGVLDFQSRLPSALGGIA